MMSINSNTLQEVYAHYREIAEGALERAGQGRLLCGQCPEWMQGSLSWLNTGYSQAIICQSATYENISLPDIVESC
jgi:hypothetical protein